MTLLAASRSEIVTHWPLPSPLTHTDARSGWPGSVFCARSTPPAERVAVACVKSYVTLRPLPVRPSSTMVALPPAARSCR